MSTYPPTEALETAQPKAAPGRLYRAGNRKDGGVGGSICPRCPVFITSTSRVVRLPRPERPDTVDGRYDCRTGDPYYYDARPIDRGPRWWVHERCWFRRDADQFEGDVL